jgi:hypothetical protein
VIAVGTRVTNIRGDLNAAREINGQAHSFPQELWHTKIHMYIWHMCSPHLANCVLLAPEVTSSRCSSWSHMVANAVVWWSLWFDSSDDKNKYSNKLYSSRLSWALNDLMPAYHHPPFQQMRTSEAQALGHLPMAAQLGNSWEGTRLLRNRIFPYSPAAVPQGQGKDLGLAVLLFPSFQVQKAE